MPGVRLVRALNALSAAMVRDAGFDPVVVGGLDRAREFDRGRWLYTITSNAARDNGTGPERFDVVARSHRVFTEYGNVGTDFSYITTEGSAG